MPDTEAPPLSPCVNNCTLGANGCCLGCYRTMEEISRWRGMSHSEQRALLRTLDERARARLDVD